MNQYQREQIENWATDFAHGDRVARYSAPLREAAAQVATTFLLAASDAAGGDTADIEQPHIKSALLEHVARLQLPQEARAGVPALCGDFLAALQDDGRLADGRSLGAYARALAGAFGEAASGTSKPFVNPGSKLGRNDPCPCGSGKKYKKCCMRE
jgi:hypothetical protein